MTYTTEWTANPDPPADSLYGQSCTFTPPATPEDPEPEPIANVPATLLRNDSFEVDAFGRSGQIESYYLPPENWYEKTANGNQTSGTSQIFPAWLMETPALFATNGDWSLHRSHLNQTDTTYLCQQWYIPEGTVSIRAGLDGRHGPNGATAGTLRLDATGDGLYLVNESLATSQQEFEHFGNHAILGQNAGGQWTEVCILQSIVGSEMMTDRVYVYAFSDEDALTGSGVGDSWPSLICPDPDLYEDNEPPDPFQGGPICEGFVSLTWEFESEIPPEWQMTGWDWYTGTLRHYHSVLTMQQESSNYLSDTEILHQLEFLLNRDLAGYGIQSTGVRFDYAVLANEGASYGAAYHFHNGTVQPMSGAHGAEIEWKYEHMIATPLQWLQAVEIHSALTPLGEQFWDNFQLRIMCDSIRPAPPDSDIGLPPPVLPGGPEAGGGVCYVCNLPAGVNLGDWIRYLLCGFTNLYGCHVRIWLMNITNSIYGVIDAGLVLIAWLPSAPQAMLNFGAAVIDHNLSYIDLVWDLFRLGLSGSIQTAINALSSPFNPDLIVAWFESYPLIQEIVSISLVAIQQIGENTVDAFVSVISIVVMIVTGTLEGLAADPYDIVIGQASTIAPSQLFEDGPNITKVLWLGLTTLGMIDNLIGRYELQALLAIPMGGMGFGVAMWTISYWRRGMVGFA